MMLSPALPYDAALLLCCRLLPCLLVWPRRDTLGLPAWPLLGVASALVVALAPLHAGAVPFTLRTASGEVLLGCGLALAGLLFLGVIASLAGFSDEVSSQRSPLWGRHLPLFALGIWALSGGAIVMVEELHAALSLLPPGTSSERILTAPRELLAAIPDIALAGALLCLPIAVLRLAAELTDALVHRWTGQRTRTARPLLPLAAGLLLLVAVSHLADRAFRSAP